MPQQKREAGEHNKFKFKYKMVKKGTARPIKFGLGIALAILVLNSLITLPLISDIANFITNTPYLQAIIMGVSAYFLIFTGRQL